MSKNLVIVESPAKAKTISRFLDKGYVVEASMGHVRDLPKSKMGIDVEREFEPTYMVPQDKKKIIAKLKSDAKDADTIWIATDEDREGEAIGWHILEALKIKEDAHVKRIVFHEITKPAILEALKNPRELDHNLIDAQQARRVLDRLVGYELSPLLWKKIRYGLSAGRVQSVAVRLIVEREREIKKFKPDEYWSLAAVLKEPKAPAEKTFEAFLAKIKDAKADLKNETSVNEIVAALTGAEFRVSNIEKKEQKRTPPPPFTTSTLQQEASRKLGFSVKKTMVLAQQLYEGIEVFGEQTGLITYMRTDSVNLSDIATKQAKEVITKEFGEKFALPSPRYYKGKAHAQEAHEAIRPVDLSLFPKGLKAFLEKDQMRLYELIWMRTIACQMTEAIVEQVGADIETKKDNKILPYVFRATGQTVVFPGFMMAYTEGKDQPEEELEEKEKFLPELEKDELLDCEKLMPEQHFTKPPPRYTEASLVKKLESESIGRPSTYAPTISTIITRGYVKKEAKQLVPTDTGEVVNDVLVEHFPNIVDYKFTAKMEDDLDEIAEGKKKWVPVISEFYQPFHQTVTSKDKSLKKSDIITEKSDEKCDKCGSPMEIKLGRFGKFLSCTAYPKCKNAKPLSGENGGGSAEKSQEQINLEKKLAHKKCDKCGSPMAVKKGRFGYFLGCSKYPDCKNIQPIIHFTGIRCGKCDGQLIERYARRTGKKFYGCNRFPKCHFATWDKPIGRCAKCDSVVVDKKATKKNPEPGPVCLECGSKDPPKPAE